MTSTRDRRHGRSARSLCLVAAASVALAAPVAAAPTTPSESPTQNHATLGNELVAVSADSTADAWAVGSRLVAGGRFRSLIEHWDGSAWRTVRSPNPGAPYDTLLRDVDALTPSDAWAVGYYWGEGLETLALHWDGDAWVQHATPSPSKRPILTSVSAVSTDDIWAVGSYTTGEEDGFSKTLALHWDGTTWSRVHTPNRLGRDGGQAGNVLRSVTAVASDDVWAVGATSSSRTLFEHWDGKRWTVVKAAGVARTGHLYSIDAVSEDDVWAVGSWDSKTFAVHWDGEKWSAVKSPNADGDTNQLNGVGAVSTSDVWAVGRSGGSPTGDGDGATLVEHWDGTRWRVVQSPNDAPFDNSLADVSAVSHDDVWAVGLYWSDWDSWYETILHWNGGWTEPA